MFLSGAVAVLGAIATAWALSAVSTRNAPELSAAVNDGNIDAQNQIAQRLLGSDVTPEAARKAVSIAKHSLGAALVNPDALRNLALGYATMGDARRASKTMKLAESQSRRDIGIELWMIEDSVVRGNVKRALQYYDRILRTSPNAQTLLFPNLAEAVADPALGPEVARLIGRHPPWAGRFVDHLVSQSPNIDAVARAIRQAGGLPPGPSSGAQERTILDRLSAEGHMGEAFRFAMSLPGSKAEALRNPDLSAESLSQRFAPLAWRLSDGVAGAVPDAGPGAAPGAVSIEINVNSDSSQIVAQKVQFLRAQSFVLEYDVSFRQRPNGEIGIWELACPTRDGNIVFGRSQPIRAAGRSAPAATRYSAPCNPIMLQLRATGGNGEESNVLTVRSVQIQYGK